MKTTIFLTGATGTMGSQGMKEILKYPDRYNLRVLARPTKQNRKKLSSYVGKIEIVWGNLRNYDDVLKGVMGCDIVLHVVGMIINLNSDHVIRNLRKPGDTRHYLPQKGLYKYVTSANYFGELAEWTGFAIAAMSPAAWVFVIWTAANLLPRANSINKKYRQEFGEKAVGRRKRVIPFVY